MYQSEIVVLIESKIARRIKKHLANCGFVTHIKEVSKDKIKTVDQFRIVIYHEVFKEYICEQTGYAIGQFEDKKQI